MKPSRLTAEQIGALSRIKVREPGLDLRRFPDFLLIGPQRTGTTWLHHHLFRHPHIFLPRKKEIYFFSRLDRNAQKENEFADLDAYLARAMSDSPRDWLRKNGRALWNSRTPYRPRIRGESTATYAILDPETIAEICAINPDLKAVMMLRDPVERAWSHARKDLFRRQAPGESDFPLGEFRKFCRASGQTRLARYSDIIGRWNAHLKPGHLFVGKFSDISEKPEETLTAIHRFLGVPAGRRYMDRSRLESRINPAPDVAIPPPALAYLREQLGEMIDDYEMLIRDLDLGASVS